jgi:hypothetical protein
MKRSEIDNYTGRLQWALFILKEVHLAFLVSKEAALKNIDNDLLIVNRSIVDIMARLNEPNEPETRPDSDK